jgi:hypothetical protein
VAGDDDSPVAGSAYTPTSRTGEESMPAAAEEAAALKVIKVQFRVPPAAGISSTNGGGGRDVRG